MNKLKLLATLAFTSLAIVSCIKDDFDLLGLSETTDSDYLIGNRIDDDFSSSNKSGVELLKTVNLTAPYTITRDSFFNDQQECFPIYNNNLSKLFLVNYDVFSKDTLLVHLKKEYIERYVDSLLSESYGYTFKKRIWKYKSKRFETISIYDPQTNDLLYDNFLFNLIQHTKKSYNASKKILTRNEGPGVLSNMETVIFSIGNESASLIMPWRITGHFVSHVKIDENGDTLKDIYGNYLYSSEYRVEECIYDTYDIVFTANFPDQNEISAERYLQVTGTTHPYYTVGLGIGYWGFSLPIALHPDYIYETFYNGYGYSYKTRIH